MKPQILIGVDWETVEKSMRDHKPGIVDYASNTLWNAARQEDSFRYAILARKVRHSKITLEDAVAALNDALKVTDNLLTLLDRGGATVPLVDNENGLLLSFGFSSRSRKRHLHLRDADDRYLTDSTQVIARQQEIARTIPLLIAEMDKGCDAPSIQKDADDLKTYFARLKRG